MIHSVSLPVFLGAGPFRPAYSVSQSSVLQRVSFYDGAIRGRGANFGPPPALRRADLTVTCDKRPGWHRTPTHIHGGPPEVPAATADGATPLSVYHCSKRLGGNCVQVQCALDHHRCQTASTEQKNWHSLTSIYLHKTNRESSAFRQACM